MFVFTLDVRLQQLTSCNKSRLTRNFLVYQEVPLQRVVFHPQEESVSKNKMQEPAFRFLKRLPSFFFLFVENWNFL